MLIITFMRGYGFDTDDIKSRMRIVTGLYICGGGDMCYYAPARDTMRYAWFDFTMKYYD